MIPTVSRNGRGIEQLFHIIINIYEGGDFIKADGSINENVRADLVSKLTGVCADRAAAEDLLSYPAMYYTCHCTGLAQYGYLKERMGERLEYIAAGQSIEL